MGGLSNNVLVAKNVNFADDGTKDAKVLSDGQLLIGSTATPNIKIATLTPGTNIGVTNGSGSITIAFDGTLPVGSGGTGATSFTDGGVLIGNGTDPVQVTSAGSVGQLLQSSGAGVDPDWTTSTYPDTTIVNGILYASATNTVGQITAQPSAMLVTNSASVPSLTTMTDGQIIMGVTGGTPTAGTLTDPAAGITITEGAGSITFALADDLAAVEGLGTTGLVSRTAANTWTTTTVTDNAFVIGDAGEVVQMVGPLTNGQLMIGSTGATPVAAAVTDGTGISTTLGAGSLTISTSTGGYTWVVVSGTSDDIEPQNGYQCTNGAATTLTLPASMAIHETFTVLCLGAGAVKIAQRDGQTIRVGNSVSTSGATGYIESTAVGDAITIKCTTADTAFSVVFGGPQGNWTIN